MRRVETIFLAFIVACLALTIPAGGQEKEPAQNTATQEQAPSGKAAKEEQVRKVIQLKYADPYQIADLLKFFGAAFRSDRETKVLTVVGPASAVSAVEEAIKKLDVPPVPPTPPPPLRHISDIELTAYFVLATRQPMQAAADLPKELDEAVAQLKRVLNYKSFQLLNTAFLRAQDGGEAVVSGVARVDSSPVDFRLAFNRANIIPEGNVRKVWISGLDFKAEQPAPPASNTTALLTKTASAGIHTSIDIQEGQKVVVGRTTLDFPDNALILVLTAKVID
jgi:hypothetical protein